MSIKKAAETHQKQNYLKMRKSNVHFKVKGNLVQLWNGSTSTATMLSKVALFGALALGSSAAFAVDSDGDGILDQNEMTYYPALMDYTGSTAISGGGCCYIRKWQRFNRNV